MARTAATPGSTEIPADKYPLLDKLSFFRICESLIKRVAPRAISPG